MKGGLKTIHRISLLLALLLLCLDLFNFGEWIWLADLFLGVVFLTLFLSAVQDTVRGRNIIESKHYFNMIGPMGFSMIFLFMIGLGYNPGGVTSLLLFLSLAYGLMNDVFSGKILRTSIYYEKAKKTLRKLKSQINKKYRVGK